MPHGRNWPQIFGMPVHRLVECTLEDRETEKVKNAFCFMLIALSVAKLWQIKELLIVYCFK